jgi:hypothetical protein
MRQTWSFSLGLEASGLWLVQKRAHELYLHWRRLLGDIAEWSAGLTDGECNEWQRTIYK